MYDCKEHGLKHSLKIWYAVDHYLVGQLWFRCEYCEAKLMVDRMYLYLAMRSPRTDSWR